jgi:predicted HicB family RNase H-like nuclease
MRTRITVTTLRVDMRLWHRVRRLALQRNVSANQFVIEAVAASLKQSQEARPLPPR